MQSAGGGDGFLAESPAGDRIEMDLGRCLVVREALDGQNRDLGGRLCHHEAEVLDSDQEEDHPW